MANSAYNIWMIFYEGIRFDMSCKSTEEIIKMKREDFLFWKKYNTCFKTSSADILFTTLKELLNVRIEPRKLLYFVFHSHISR